VNAQDLVWHGPVGKKTKEVLKKDCQTAAAFFERLKTGNAKICPKEYADLEAVASG